MFFPWRYIAGYKNFDSQNQCVDSNFCYVATPTHAYTPAPQMSIAPTSTPEVIEETKPETTNALDRAKAMDGSHGGQCVVFIQKLYATWNTHPDFRGAAGNIEPTSTSTYAIGDAVLTDEGPVGHVSLITGIEGEDLILCDSNYSKHNDEIVRCGRRLSIHDERIRGYFNF